MSKRKITLSDLEHSAGISRLEADGFSKREVIQAIHNHTDQHSYSGQGGKDRDQQREMVDKLFDRTIK